MIEGMSSQGSLFAMFDKTNSKSNEVKKSKCLLCNGENKVRVEIMMEGMSSQSSLFAMFDKTNSKSNELKNPIVWSGCPKSLFCDIYFIRILVCNAMTQFNDDTYKEKVSHTYSRN